MSRQLLAVTWSKIRAGSASSARCFHAWFDGRTLCGQRGEPSTVGRAVRPWKHCSKCNKAAQRRGLPTQVPA